MFADLAVHETVRDELQDLDLTRGWILTALSRDLRSKRDDRPVPARAAARSRRFEAAAMVAVAVEDLLALSSVHAWGIGGQTVPL